MKTGVRAGSIVLAFLLAVAVAPRAGTRPAEAGRIVVANEHASTVQFFDLKTGNGLKDIPTLKRPHEMVLDRNRGVAYISIAYKDGPFSTYERPGNEIQAIGLDSMAIVDTIDITPHWAPHGLALDGNRQILYASCESNGGELIGIDLRAKKVELSVNLGGVPHPHSVTVIPSLNKAYTANKDAGHISVVDLTKKTVTQIPTPSGTEGITSTLDGKYVLAGNQTRSELLVIDPKKDEIVKKVALDQPPSTLALSPDGRKLYITFWNQKPGKPTWEDGFIQQLDVPTLTPGPKLKVGHFPLNLSIAPDGKTAVVDTTADGAVAVVDLSQLKIVRTIKTDEWPHGIAVF
jgi:DNA-binding beta-propeller fold protein YncE